MEEEEPIPKRKLIKKGLTFTQDLQLKRAKITSKKHAVEISIREPSPKATQAEKMPKSRNNKAKHMEINVAALPPIDLE